MTGSKDQFLDETVLITGSSRGIGRATALEFGSRGANVIVNYRSNEDAAGEVVDEIKSSHPEAAATAVQADLSTVEGVDALFDAAEDEYGNLDVFVHNAAVTAFKPLAEVSKKEIDLTFNLSVHGFVLSTQRAVELMDEGGRIVTISGIDSTISMPGHGLLGAAKAALEQLTRYVAVEHGSDGIRANSVNVGVSETDSSNYYAESTEGAREFLDLLVDETPLKEITSPEAIASAVVMLCSDDSQDVSGQVLYVDNGLTARF